MSLDLNRNSIFRISISLSIPEEIIEYSPLKDDNALIGKSGRANVCLRVRKVFQVVFGEDED